MSYPFASSSSNTNSASQYSGKRTEAQEEFDSILAKASNGPRSTQHPGNDADYRNDQETGELGEEEQFRNLQIDENMRMPSFGSHSRGASVNTGTKIHLPHRDFDSGRTTGVKGVIADARSYEEARRNNGGLKPGYVGGGKSRTLGNAGARASTFLMEDGEGSESEDEEFLERWRQQRREELLREGSDIRNRRTSPSVRRYGRFDEVDALGYLDAIEKVTRDTVVVVFVYDPDCPVSNVISEALAPLVPTHPHIHFVKVHYADIEFDNAGVPAVLAYKNQGELFANLTYIIDQIPDDTIFDTRALESILRKNKIL